MMQSSRIGLNPHKLSAAATTALRWLLLLLLVAFSLTPIIWLMMTSLKSRALILASTPVFVFKPDFSAYFSFLSFGNQTVLPNLANSLIIALLTTFATLVLSSLAAYGFSRYHFAGRRSLLLLMLATRLLPPITAIVPLFMLMDRWELIDTRQVLILIYTALSIPLATWMMKAFFDGVPTELEEAALIDGANRMQALYHVTLRLAAPGMAATSIFTFVLSWNDFLFAFIFTSINARTMPVLLSETIGELEIFWQNMATLATIVVIPTLIFSLLAQRNLVKGLTVGALK
jgi:multiple sugar transport system permease protein